jgi:Domain of unknown function (DUF4249)
MQKLKYIFSTLFILSIWSCDTIVDDVVLPYEERLVIQSFISPQDTLLEVRVSKTKPVTGTFTSDQFYGNGTYKPLVGAIIEISDGQKKASFKLQTVTNPAGTEYDQSTGKIITQTRTGYFLRTKDFPIIAGRTYTLTAKAPNLPEVSAICTVPNKTLIYTLDINVIKGNLDTVQSGGSYVNGVLKYRYYYLTKRIDVNVKDVANEENFYAVAYYSQKVTQYKDNSTGKIQTQYIYNQEPYTNFITDYRQDGKVLNFIKTGVNFGYYTDDPSQPNNPNQPKTISHNLSIFVAITDKAYYQYNKTVVGNGGLNDGNPFAEPVLTYTNINGGLGAFGGYNMTKIDVDLLK